MSYITKEMAVEAIHKMQDFHERQRAVHELFGIDFVSNRGRRNVIMSHAQEHFFAQSLGKEYKGVRADGRTGESDIYIGELDKEVECKITTPFISTGAIVFQTDYATLKKKGKLDYLYVIACPEFKRFCVLHFVGLTTDDFRLPSPGGRGRAQMIKSIGLKKCNVLYGTPNNLTENKVANLKAYFDTIEEDYIKDINDVDSKVKFLKGHLKSDTDPQDNTKLNGKKRSALKQKIKRAENRPNYLLKMVNKRRQRVRSDIRDWQNKPDRFTFVLETLSGE
tara:strand:+ start:420 stop:1256 length:837 start_codon:yes stop_codon:yes gene_type:complete